MMTRRGAVETGFMTTAAALLTRAGLASAVAPTAKGQGYFMPLESGPHLRTFMQWPALASIYGGKAKLEQVRKSIALIANTIGRFERVVVLVRPDQIIEAKKQLDAGVEVWPLAVEDLWCRDSGPSFLLNKEGELAVSELNFNGWGNKQVHRDDGAIAKHIADKLKLPVFSNPVIGEGGGVETDGAGTLLAHASSWVNRNRNKGSQGEIGTALTEALGAEKIIWAPGVAGEDITDYHIDALARFVKPGQVLIQLPDKITDDDPWSAAAFETYDVLKQASDASGRKLEIVVMRDPVDIRSSADDFVSSYVNYYVCNGAVIMPEFGDDKADEEAASIVRQLYLDRKIVSLNIDPIGEAGGGIHCATQQQPQPVT